MVTITTKLSKPQAKAAIVKAVQGITKGATGRQLAGFITHEVLQENRKDFLRKAEGLGDREGNLWKPLALITIFRRKEKRLAKIQPLIDKQFDTAIKRGGASGLAAKQAKDKTQRGVRQGVFEQRELIHIETGRMFAALDAGPLSGGHYTPPAEQAIQIDANGFQVITEVDYTQDCHDGGWRIIQDEGKYVEVAPRPIFPPARLTKDWVARGTAKFLEFWGGGLEI